MELESIVKIDFHPNRIGAGNDLARIFENDDARTLFLAAKQSDMDHSPKHYLKFAKALKKYKPDDPESLLKVLTKVPGGIGRYNLEFARALFPYIMGEKLMSYEVDSAAIYR